MIVDDPQRFLDGFARLQPTQDATARAAFLVSPLGFHLAAESASDNRYMAMSATPDAYRALREHGELARRLADDLPVFTFPGDPASPDGVFPNNAFATVPGRLITGRMRHAVRRRETRRADIRSFFERIMSYEIVDLEPADCIAELTGAMVIDRARRVGFCGLSERCDRRGAAAMHVAFGLELTFCFELASAEYHANVVLAVLAGRAAIVAADGFADAAAAEAISEAYHPHVVEIDRAQKQAYSGNAIALTPARAWLSTSGAAALRPAQLAVLEQAGFAIAATDLATLECAGGSLRCCVAEIY
ncbi:MAG: arginine deiminase-related protein [Rhodanobacteraceae bacterium]